MPGGATTDRHMICENCKKHKATVHLTDLVNNENRHLCEQCAVEEGITFKQHVPINELLTNFVMTQAGAQEVADLTCDECGISFVEFRNQGLLGCPNDYEVFSKPLDSLLQRAHDGATQHVGKVPAYADGEQTRQASILRLRAELRRAIAAEDYELAASLRDQIKELEAQ